MNLAQTLGAAAAALVMGLSGGGVAPAETLSEIAAEARARLEPSAIRGVAEALAGVLEHHEVLPEMASRYGERAAARAGAAEDLAMQIAIELNAESSACDSSQPPQLESERVELDRAPWRHDLPDAKIHLGRRTARL